MSPNTYRQVTQESVSSEQLGTILKSRKSTVEFAILRATKTLLATTGLNVSMDAIAEEAGISRRTLFRHFSVRDELVARALDESLAYFHELAAQDLPSTSDLREWLSRTVAALHSTQIGAGRGLWQLAASDDDELPPVIAAVNKKRRDARHQTTRAIAQEAWKRSGRKGAVPRKVEVMFALAFSSFAARSLNVDYGITEEDSVDALVELLATFLEN